MLEGAMAVVGAFFIVLIGFVYTTIQMIRYEQKYEDEENDDLKK
jgi:hypothetical protein